MSYAASCLCGKVNITASKRDDKVGACHCSTCRKWGGGPFMAVDCGDAVQFEGEDFIQVFDSSEWADRGFCKACGTHLFYRLKQTQQYFMLAGLFDSEEALEFDHQVFIEEKPTYYDFANQTKNMTGAELFAAFEAEQASKTDG